MPYIGEGYKDSLVLVLDRFVLKGFSSPTWLTLLLSGAAREQIPAIKAVADKCRTIHDLTGVLLGEPFRLMKGDDFAVWKNMSYYVADCM